MSHDTANIPRVSVIIVNYNGGEWLTKSVQSLQTQTVTGFECFIVDNGSTDGSLETLPKLDDRFEIIETGENMGFAAGNNLAARKANADWLALLNPDAFAHPNWLEELLSTPGLATLGLGGPVTMVGSRQNMALEADTLDGLGDFYHVTGLAWRAACGHQIYDGIQPYHEAFGPCGAAALYHRETFLRLGGFDEAFFCYHEDVDVAYRMRLDGGICIQNNKAIVDHVSSGISGRASEFAVYHGTRNRIWTFMKNTPALMKLFYLPAHILMNLAVLCWSIFRPGRFGPTFRGIKDGFFKRPRSTKPERKIPLRQINSAIAWWPLTVIKRNIPNIMTLPESTWKHHE